MEKTLVPEKIASFALSKVGVREQGGANKGPALKEFFESDWYDPNGSKPGDDGYAWCASFVCWAVKKALEEADIKETATFKRPRTPGAWDFENWCKSVDRTAILKKPHDGDIKRGDLVIFKFSHIGIALSSPDKDGIIETVEGNTNSAGSREGDGVYRKKRSILAIRSRIRFMV
jgi:hypothetical protein